MTDIRWDHEREKRTGIPEVILSVSAMRIREIPGADHD